MSYQINEIFDSWQGEGYWTGVPATFIRLQGCPVGCEWCDTRYTWGAGGTRMAIEEIMAQVDRMSFVVITGGEPLLYDLDELIFALKFRECYVQIETSGFTWYKGKERAQWLTWSPKPKLDWWAPYEIFKYCNEIKFVVDDEIQGSRAFEVVDKSLMCHGYDKAKPQVTLMPEGCPPSDKAMINCRLFAQWCMAKFPWLGVGGLRISDRLQYRLGVR